MFSRVTKLWSSVHRREESGQGNTTSSGTKSPAIVVDDDSPETTTVQDSNTSSARISCSLSPERPPLATLRKSSREDVPRFRRVLSERELLWRRALEHTDETDTVTKQEMEAHLKWIEEFRADFEKDLGRLSPGKMRRGYSYLAEEIGIPQNPQEELIEGKDHVLQKRVTPE